MATSASLLESFKRPAGRREPLSLVRATNIQDEIILEKIKEAATGLVMAVVNPSDSVTIDVEANAYRTIFMSAQFKSPDDYAKFIRKVMGGRNSSIQRPKDDLSIAIQYGVGEFLDNSTVICDRIRAVAARTGTLAHVTSPLWQAVRLISARRSQDVLPKYLC